MDTRRILDLAVECISATEAEEYAATFRGAHHPVGRTPDDIAADFDATLKSAIAAAKT